MHLIFLVFFFFCIFYPNSEFFAFKPGFECFSMQKILNLDRNAKIKKLKKSNASEITIDESDFFLFAKICPIFHIQNSWGGK